MRYAPAPCGTARLFEPKWSEEIIRETTRTLESKLRWPHSLTAHFERELRAHFGEAWISGYESLIPRMTNDEKDRQVVAAAVHGGAAIVLTLNLRHFRPEHHAAISTCWGVPEYPKFNFIQRGRRFGHPAPLDMFGSATYLTQSLQRVTRPVWSVDCKS